MAFTDSTLPDPVNTHTSAELDSPPPALRSPKKAAPTSLYQDAGRNIMNGGQSGLGPEGGSPEIMDQRFLGMIQMGIQGLSAKYPGLTPLLADIIGRLMTAVPILSNDLAMGGQGLVPIGGMPPQQPMGQGMGGGMPMPMGAPPGGPMPGGPPMMGQGPIAPPPPMM